jgi:predicted cation transporter
MRAKLRKEERYDTGNVVQYHNTVKNIIKEMLNVWVWIYVLYLYRF